MAFELDADAIVEKATSKGSFDVFDFVKGSNLPTNDVVIYTDADAALKLAKIFTTEALRAKQSKDNADSFSLADDFETEVASEEVISDLHTRLISTSLTFHLQGLAPAAVSALEKHLKATTEFKEGAENTAFTEAFNNALIVKSIVSVERTDGAINTDKWTVEQVADFLGQLYISEANKIYEGVAEINYIGAIFDRAVNADFS